MLIPQSKANAVMPPQSLIETLYYVKGLEWDWQGSQKGITTKVIAKAITGV